MLKGNSARKLDCLRVLLPEHRKVRRKYVLSAAFFYNNTNLRIKRNWQESSIIYGGNAPHKKSCHKLSWFAWSVWQFEPWSNTRTEPVSESCRFAQKKFAVQANYSLNNVGLKEGLFTWWNEESDKCRISIIAQIMMYCSLLFTVYYYL